MGNVPVLRARALVATVAVAAAGPALTGCGGSPSSHPAASASSTTSASTTTSATSATTTTSPAGSSTSTPSGVTPQYEVKTGTVKGLGTVLVDGQGFTLYMFEPDKQSGQSTCYGNCASAWPPLILPDGVTAGVAGPGVNPSLLGVTKRTDGTTQVTYDKWPLYLWVTDSEPGQATGQGLDNNGGLWYVLNPAGQVVKTSAS